MQTEKKQLILSNGRDHTQKVDTRREQLMPKQRELWMLKREGQAYSKKEEVTLSRGNWGKAKERKKKKKTNSASGGSRSFQAEERNQKRGICACGTCRQEKR